MYKIKDYVTYGMQGVCQVSDIIAKMTGDVSVDYYVLLPVHSGAAVYVPMDNETLLSRIHPLLGVEEMKSLLLRVPSLPDIWEPNDGTRKDIFKNILMSGERDKLCSLIKTLYRHREEQRERGKKLHLTDERYLKEAEKILFYEVAQVLGKKLDEVINEFIEMLK